MILLGNGGGGGGGNNYLDSIVYNGGKQLYYST
jgi:hypothetical protein